MEKRSLTPNAFAPVAAGVIAYPERKALAFSFRDEFLEADGDDFGTTGTSKASASRVIPTNDPVFLQGIYFAQYRTAGTAPLGTYLPTNGFIDTYEALVQGLNFTFELRSSQEGRNMQEGARDSLMLGKGNYLKLPEDQELSKDEIITIDVEPLVEAALGDEYRMFMVLDCYKMVE